MKDNDDGNVRTILTGNGGSMFDCESLGLIVRGTYPSLLLLATFVLSCFSYISCGDVREKERIRFTSSRGTKSIRKSYMSVFVMAVAMSFLCRVLRPALMECDQAL